MIKYIKNTLFLLILLYNNLLVNAQYKTLLTPNLLNFGQDGRLSDRLFSNGDHTKFGDGRMNSFGRNPKVGNPPNSFAEDTISNDAAGSFEQDTKVTNNLLNTHQETKNSKINNIGQDAKVTDKPNLGLNRIYRQLLNHLLLRKENGNGRTDTKNEEDGEEFNRKPRQTEEAVPTGRRRLKKLKTVYADRVDTSTDTNRDDAYYVTNIESTNVDKQGIGAESSGEMDGKTETNAKTTTTQGASERKFEVYAESPATHKDDGRKFEVYPANRDKDKFENHASNNDGINTKENYASNSDGIDTKETHGNGDGKETYAKGAIDRKFEYGGNSLESKEILDSVTSEVTRNTIDESVRKIEQDEYTNKYNEMDLNPVNTTDSEQETSKANGQSSAETASGNVKSGTDQGNAQLDSKDKGNDDKTTKGVGEVYQTSSESDNDTSARNNTSGQKSNQSGENFKKLFTTHAGPGRFFEHKKDLLKTIVVKRCHNRYSFMCFKIDLMKIIDRLNSTDQFTVLPGVHIVRTIDPSTSPLDLPPSLILSILRNSTTDTSQLDEALLIKLRNYLSQLSVHVKLLDTAFLMESNETALSTESTGRTFFTSWKDTLTNFMGRGKKQNYGHAAIWSAGTLAALGFAMLAALSGKALVTSILALVLAAICAFKGHGHGHGGYGNYGYGKTSHYEIITKPAHYHDHEHLHSTSLAAAASPYASYARQLVPSLFEETQLSEATDPYSYVSHEERSL